MENKMQANKNIWICFGLGVLVGIGLCLRLVLMVVIPVGGFYLFHRKRRIALAKDRELV